MSLCNNIQCGSWRTKHKNLHVLTRMAACCNVPHGWRPNENAWSRVCWPHHVIKTERWVVSQLAFQRRCGIASVIFLTHPLFLCMVWRGGRLQFRGREQMRSTSGSAVVLFLLFLLSVVGSAVSGVVRRHDLAGVQPLSRVAIHKARLALEDKAYVKASPLLLGIKVVVLQLASSATLIPLALL